MANAALDENSVASITGVLDSDGQTIVRIKVNPSNHGLMVDDNTTGADNGPTNDLRDENERVALMAVSSDDGITPVVVYANSDGELLINSN